MDVIPVELNMAQTVEYFQLLDQQGLAYTLVVSDLAANKIELSLDVDGQVNPLKIVLQTSTFGRTWDTHHQVEVGK